MLTICPGTVSMLTVEGEIVGEFPVGRWPVALAFDGEALWVANVLDKSVMRLALDGSSIGEIVLDLRPVAVAVVGENLWVLAATDDGGSGLITVLSRSLEELATYATGAPSLNGVVFDGGHVWLANPRDSTVTKMAMDGTVVATIEVEGGPLALSAGDGAIWVTTLWGTLVQLDLDGQILSVSLAGGNPVATAWDGNALWIVLPANVNSFTPTAVNGGVSRIVVHDAPVPPALLHSSSEASTPADADLSRYVLSQRRIARVPGCGGGWSGDVDDLLEWLAEDADIAALFEAPGLGGGIATEGCDSDGDAVGVNAFQGIFQFATQDDAARFFDRVRDPDYPFRVLAQPLVTGEVFPNYEVWYQELDAGTFGPGPSL